MKTISGMEFLLLEQWKQGAEQAVHIELARANFAIHMTLLGISRWTGESTLVALQLAKAISPSSRVAWLDAANTNFQHWLEAGGFAQPEPETLAASCAESTLSPAGDAGTQAPMEAPDRPARNVTGSRRRKNYSAKNPRDGIAPSIPCPSEFPSHLGQS